MHQRLLNFGIPESRWPSVIQELVRVTCPRGWIELVEVGTPQGGPALSKIGQWSQELTMRRGINTYITTYLGGFLGDAGLAAVRQREVRLPLGPHGGRVGKMVAANSLSVMRSFSGPAVTMGIVSEGEYAATLAAAEHEINTLRCWLPFYMAIGARAA